MVYNVIALALVQKSSIIFLYEIYKILYNRNRHVFRPEICERAGGGSGGFEEEGHWSFQVDPKIVV